MRVLASPTPVAEVGQVAPGTSGSAEGFAAMLLALTPAGDAVASPESSPNGVAAGPVQPATGSTPNAVESGAGPEVDPATGEPTDDPTDDPTDSVIDPTGSADPVQPSWPGMIAIALPQAVPQSMPVAVAPTSAAVVPTAASSSAAPLAPAAGGMPSTMPVVAGQSGPPTTAPAAPSAVSSSTASPTPPPPGAAPESPAGPAAAPGRTTPIAQGTTPATATPTAVTAPATAAPMAPPTAPATTPATTPAAAPATTPVTPVTTPAQLPTDVRPLLTVPQTAPGPAPESAPPDLPTTAPATVATTLPASPAAATTGAATTRASGSGPTIPAAVVPDSSTDDSMRSELAGSHTEVVADVQDSQAQGQAQGQSPGAHDQSALNASPQPAAPQPTRVEGEARTDATGVVAATTAPSATPVTAPPVAVTSVTATPGTGGHAASGVAHQVFERIERLATSGDGTHRISLRLDPGTLGEVRVHLTVREGRVRVRLTAGADARIALAQGAPDLQRLLKRAGTADVHVDVSAGGFSHQSGGQPSGDPHDLPRPFLGSEDPGSRTGHQGAPARMRSATTATDGDQDRSEGPGSVDPRTSTPLGVDVRM